MADKLTPKQQRFVEEYLVDLNATQAAIRAGYSEKSAARISVELLNKTQVQKSIEKAQAKRAERTEVTADRVVTELAKIAFADPRDLMEWGPDGLVLKDCRTIPDAAAAAVSEVSESNDGIKLKKLDKLKALELLGRHLGMFTDKVKMSGELDIATIIMEARNRADKLR